MRGTNWVPLIRRFASEFYRELKITLSPLPKPEKWVFIVGCYNSGTTLLHEILTNHPQIGYLPTEGHFLTDQLPSEHELDIPRMWHLRKKLFQLESDDSLPDATRIKREWSMRLKNRNSPILLEKSPQNGARMPWLQDNFENAHFIALIRNGYAVAEGIRRKAQPSHPEGGWPIELCARQWAISNNTIHTDLPKINNLLWVKYEDLTEKPENELIRILNFIGANDKEYLLETQNRTWRIHERSENIKNMNAESIARLNKQDIDIINNTAGRDLEFFGYKTI